MPKNSESRVIGAIIRDVRKNTNWKLLISYADPRYGHIGTIYKATGWLYFGMTAPAPFIIVNGKYLHARSSGSLYGSASIRHLRLTGIPAIKGIEPGKHKYAYFLDPSWQFRLKTPVLPYPKDEINVHSGI